MRLKILLLSISLFAIGTSIRGAIPDLKESSKKEMKISEKIAVNQNFELVEIKSFVLENEMVFENYFIKKNESNFHYKSKLTEQKKVNYKYRKPRDGI